MPPSSNYKHYIKASAAAADAASVCCAIGLIALIILMSSTNDAVVADEPVRGIMSQLVDRPCDEIYVVGDGETLHSISEKCGDPYIVERNPHVHDPDDVFPGLVLKIVSPTSSKLSIR
ncbi:hypothetical protein Salat_0797000 [Sesamum alatum]|uniref:LysM domain-containing protein n=1 Tax=Sesamum alatum TaxID=300844 RepID=A0AAE1YV63_9LAMI|nr:hypothetical protein Salat_0797000 [Sesamum alatum]